MIPELKNHGEFPIKKDNFRNLSDIHIDSISEILKEIAEKIDWDIKSELIHKKFSDIFKRKNSWNDEYILKELKTKLNDLANNPDKKFAEASSKLFGWLFKEKKFDDLKNLQIISRSGKSLSLKSAKDDEPYLAPVKTWEKKFQKFCELFPQEMILGDELFEVLPNAGLWKRLDEHMVSVQILISKEVKSLPFIDEISRDDNHQKRKTQDNRHPISFKSY